MTVQQQMDGGADSLKERIAAILTDDFNPWFPGSEYGRDILEETRAALLKLFQEWAESYVPETPPYPVESKDLQMLHDGAVQGFDDCRTQTIKNIKGDN